MFRGSLPALVTPFKDGAVDYDTLKRLVEWHIAQGSHGLVPVGTTGESPTLSHREHEDVVSFVVEAVAGRSFELLEASGPAVCSRASMRALRTCNCAFAGAA